MYCLICNRPLTGSNYGSNTPSTWARNESHFSNDNRVINGFFCSSCGTIMDEKGVRVLEYRGLTQMLLGWV